MSVCGWRNANGGGFINFGTEAVWWSSSVSGTGSWDRVLNTGYTSVARSVMFVQTVLVSVVSGT